LLAAQLAHLVDRFKLGLPALLKRSRSSTSRACGLLHLGEAAGSTVMPPASSRWIAAMAVSRW
jgi:hypothetical protein